MSSFHVRQSGQIQVIVNKPLEEAGFLNAFSTRPGGLSPLPNHDLNLVFNHDAPSNVEKNRILFLHAAGLPSWPIITVKQTHSNIVVRADKKGQAEVEADSVYTQLPEALVGVKTADCVPILVGDPSTGMACAIHAGWRGAASNIIQAAMEALKKDGANMSAMVAAIGPAACANCFEIKSDVANMFESAGYQSSLQQDGEKIKLDVPDVCFKQLNLSGLSERHIHLSGRCTIHEPGLFFSHRREGQQDKPVGRMLSVIGRRA